MAVDVQKVVKECEVCKITKTANKNDRPPMGEQRVTERDGQRLFIDFMAVETCRDMHAAEVIKFLETKIFHQYGVPEFIHSDNGKQFVSQIFGELMNRYGIRHVKTGLPASERG
ncbi:uncharacterized protein [Drosophila suzukii]|uniref:Integrase catalytic domain-containing protein n=1 Tax=Drosophila suzukii TaxID=28584 RepID=A0ABM4TXS1_DROSZ